MKRVIQSTAALLLAGAALLASAHAAGPAKGASDAKTDRLTDLMVELVPMGRIFEMLAKDDPKWPMQDKPDAVTPTQLSCLRSELSTAGYRRAKRKDVAEYVSTHPSRIDADVTLLEGGAAAMMGRLMMAGAEGERTGVKVSEQEVLGSATPEQLASFMAFMTAPDHADLRKLSGLGNAFSTSKSSEENEQSGEAAGENLATQVMLRAMSACEVSMATLFN
ncbi:MAG TPA: hypothetical protein VGE64_06490 [Xanthomonadaceae bacterium]